jgi:hypothetical protein
LEKGIRFVNLCGNLFIENTRLSLELLDQQDLDIILCTMNGRLLIQKKQKNIVGVVNLFFDTSIISKGVYFLSVEGSEGVSIIKKLVKI